MCIFVRGNVTRYSDFAIHSVVVLDPLGTGSSLLVSILKLGWRLCGSTAVVWSTYQIICRPHLRSVLSVVTHSESQCDRHSRCWWDLPLQPSCSLR